ncbi:mesoderm posterior protein 2-like [Pristis pectinata]|uniref:mesoderm posterior protein 2-like n=1 Tax=Pristis pectinata TaxID=685728 RepID=UPI00223CB195|nr:mesoderm posterior protein 2-like [Pristis pectinata]XP_051896552.1 mesoderm posterior protein 2-like [Pristis pectinata]XP_051896553.1 mesoderm posterior protein 2-like [Pristis pectinata]
MDVTPQEVLHQGYVTISGYGAVLDCGSLSSGSNEATDWNSINSETNRSSDSSADSCQYSPQPPPSTTAQEASANSCKVEVHAVPSEDKSDTGRQVRKVRLRHSSRERQNASEREKLRMRGLAKALHNLRTYLPPSVAPAAQSLTKLETLRLTIRYIAHLTELLALSEECPSAGRDTEGMRRVGCRKAGVRATRAPHQTVRSIQGGR